MHINPGLRLLRRNRSSMQVGLDGGLVLDGLTDGDCAVIAGLTADRDAESLAALAQRHGVEPHRLADLVAALAPVLCEAPQGRNGLRADRLAGELDQLRALHHRAAALLLDRRAAAVVRVHGVGGLATAVLTGLAAGGVGRLVADDGPPVVAAEIGPGGMSLAQLGLDRPVALRHVVRAVAPDAVIECRPAGVGAVGDGRIGGASGGGGVGGAGPATGDRVGDGRIGDVAVGVRRPVPSSAARPAEADLTVITATDVVPGRMTAEAGAASGVLLPVIARERDHVVGPLVVPGLTPCLACRERHRADTDPAWPDLRDQLAVHAAGPVAATSAVPATAALAVVQVLAFLDGEHRPASWSAELVLRVADGRTGRRPCLPHPACSCGVAPAPATGPTPGGGIDRVVHDGVAAVLDSVSEGWPDWGFRRGPGTGHDSASTASTASP